MFGNKRRIAALEAQVHALEAQIRALTERPEVRVEALLNAMTDRVRRQLEATLADAERARGGVARLEESALAAEAAARTLRAAFGSEGASSPREVPLAQVQRAGGFGFVAVWFNGGRTDRVALRVGWSDPPQTQVGRINCAASINSYAATVVRPGEYWIADSERPETSGVTCWFTPFA